MRYSFQFLLFVNRIITLSIFIDMSIWTYTRARSLSLFFFSNAIGSLADVILKVFLSSLYRLTKLLVYVLDNYSWETYTDYKPHAHLELFLESQSCHYFYSHVATFLATNNIQILGKSHYYHCFSPAIVYLFLRCYRLLLNFLKNFNSL